MPENQRHSETSIVVTINHKVIQRHSQRVVNLWLRLYYEFNAEFPLKDYCQN